MASPVDEERRCPVDAAADAASEVVSHSALELSIVKRLAQCRYGELQLFGKSHEKLAVQVLLIFKQEIVHLPEFSAGAPELCGLGSGFGMRMNLAQRKIPENKAEPFPKMFLHTLDYRIRMPAMRAFVVSILH